MRKDRYVKRHFHKKSLTLVLALALSCVLLVCGVVGGTLAWLTADTDPVVNTFTTSDINITLTETTTDFKMIPGWTIDKDPIVTVEAGSEDCYVFLKVEESGGNVTVDDKTCSFEDFIDYEIDSNNWTPLGDSYPGIYYCKYENRNDVDINIKVLAGGTTSDGYSWEPNQVLTLPTVTKDMMNAINADNQPKLTFTAYASQYWKNSTEFFSAEQAWQNIPGNS